MPFFTGIGQPVNAVDPGATSGANGRLRIDPNQLDAAIAVFQDALNTVESEVMWARQSMDARRLADDQVSGDVVDAFNRIGYKNDNSAVVAWEGAVVQLRSVVQQLQAAKNAIVLVDDKNASGLQVL